MIHCLIYGIYRFAVACPPEVRPIRIPEDRLRKAIEHLSRQDLVWPSIWIDANTHGFSPFSSRLHIRVPRADASGMPLHVRSTIVQVGKALDREHQSNEVVLDISDALLAHVTIVPVSAQGREACASLQVSLSGQRLDGVGRLELKAFSGVEDDEGNLAVDFSHPGFICGISEDSGDQSDAEIYIASGSPMSGLLVGMLWNGDGHRFVAFMGGASLLVPFVPDAGSAG